MHTDPRGRVSHARIKGGLRCDHAHTPRLVADEQIQVQGATYRGTWGHLQEGYMGPRRTHNSLMTACLSPSPYGESYAWRVRAASCALRSVCGGITTHRGRHGFLATLLLLLLMAANAPGANAAAGAPAPVANALLPAPGTRHSFVRVNVPGTESELDFVAIGADASLVKGLPALGWIDASAAHANTKAAPLLTIAGAVCLPAFKMLKKCE